MHAPTDRTPTDQELDISVAGMLRFGVGLAAVVVLAGGLLSLRHPGAMMPDYAHFHAADASLRTVAGVVHGAMQISARSIIQLGLLLLIATPIARVVFCVVGFARQRDRLYVAISSVVLLILIYSLVKGDG
jgi:uncharacterized membrane protein